MKPYSTASLLLIIIIQIIELIYWKSCNKQFDVICNNKHINNWTQINQNFCKSYRNDWINHFVYCNEFSSQNEKLLLKKSKSKNDIDSEVKNLIEASLKSQELRLRLLALVIISIQFEVQIFKGRDH
jgi:hypothetical protein